MDRLTLVLIGMFPASALAKRNQRVADLEAHATVALARVEDQERRLTALGVEVSVRATRSRPEC